MEMTFNQISSILQAIVNQATGKNDIAPANTSEFVAVAETALKTGYDPILNAISQVLSNTIFSIRPYTRKFRGIEATATQWGNHVRKIKISDRDLTDDQRYSWPMGYDATGHSDNPTGNGEAVDMYTIRKPSILQTNFYGSNVYQDYFTIFRDQLDCAFRGPDEFASFVSLIMTNSSNMLETARETMARSTVCNLIGAVIDEGAEERNIHLLTEYNTLTGGSFTAETIYQPENYKAFIQWVYSRMADVSKWFTERSTLYQTTITTNGVSHYINQHTDYENQRIFIYAPTMHKIDSMVLSNTFNSGFLKMAVTEEVSYWQSIKTPDTINITPSYTDSTGTAKTGSEVNKNNIFALLCDREALGYAITQSWGGTTPFNVAGGYTNYWLHDTTKCWVDNTEKAVVFLLD